MVSPCLLLPRCVSDSFDAVVFVHVRYQVYITIFWAEMRKSTSVFTCKGCTEVAMLVGEVEDLRKMMESLKSMVTGQGLEEK